MMQGTAMDPQAEVILNGGLLNMSKFTNMKKKQVEARGLAQVTTQLLQEQATRQNYQTVEGLNRMSMEHGNEQSPSPNRFDQDFYGPTSGKAASSMRDDQSEHRMDDRNKSPRVELDPLLRESIAKKQIAQMQGEQQQLFNRNASPGLTLSQSPRPQTNSDANRSPFNKPLDSASQKKRSKLQTNQNQRFK